ncbi:hypothetical protein [Allokutzneria oryzae]|uniref:DUF4240 domain-containing protein n=1 Tax=Allokutzneria oryzae TaxID=1378989 RepID=A0ABV5ZR32_9PSEU
MELSVWHEFREYMLEDDDWYSFSSAVAAARHALGGTDDVAWLRMAIDGTARLVREGAITPGSLTDDGFEPWPGTPEASAERIEREGADYLARGDFPDLSDICWFENPSRPA